MVGSVGTSRWAQKRGCHRGVDRIAGWSHERQSSDRSARPIRLTRHLQRLEASRNGMVWVWRAQCSWVRVTDYNLLHSSGQCKCPVADIQRARLIGVEERNHLSACHESEVSLVEDEAVVERCVVHPRECLKAANRVERLDHARTAELGGGPLGLTEVRRAVDPEHIPSWRSQVQERATVVHVMGTYRLLNAQPQPCLTCSGLRDDG